MGIPLAKAGRAWGVVLDVGRDGLFVGSRTLMAAVSLLQQIGVIP